MNIRFEDVSKLSTLFKHALLNVSKASFVSSADVILEIIDTDHIHLELSVFDKDILKIKKGQKIGFRIPETSDNIYNDAEIIIGGSK